MFRNILFLGLAGVLCAGTAQADTLDVRAYYSFDGVTDADGSGYTFNSTDYYEDLSGTGHHAVLMKNGTVGTDDPIGTTAKFGNSFRAARGTDQNYHTYLSVPDTTDLNFTGNDNLQPFTA